MKYTLTMIITCMFALSVMVYADDVIYEQNKVQCAVNSLQAKYLSFMYFSYERGYVALVGAYQQEEEKSWQLLEHLAVAAGNDDEEKFDEVNELIMQNAEKLLEIKGLFADMISTMESIEKSADTNSNEFFEIYECEQYAIAELDAIGKDFCEETENELCIIYDK